MLYSPYGAVRLQLTHYCALHERLDRLEIYSRGRTTRVLTPIERGVTAPLRLGDDRSGRRHTAPQIDETAARATLGL
jgi:hypothetical protein